jgi:hypothetical protein
MPDPVVIRSNETAAFSNADVEMMAALEEQGVQEQGDGLLAGKYTSVAELEKAYQELQSQFSRDRAGQEEPEDSEESEEEEVVEERGAKEIYGDLIGGKLEEAGIDFADMNERWQASGELTKSDYKVLGEAGFSTAMVDSYLAGLGYQQAADSQMSAQQVIDVKNTVGGEAEYNSMVEWAAANLTPEDINAFDEVVNTQPLSVIKLAAEGMYAKYSNNVGREPKLYGGRSPAAGADVFESSAQVVEAMGDPKYKTDAAYRKKVQTKLGRSSVF